MTTTQASRTNLTSKNVDIDEYNVIGRGSFRLAFSGTYRGGNRNMQEAVCKRFRPQYQQLGLENEFFKMDFVVADKAIDLALRWNQMCEVGKEILITRGDVLEYGQHRYMVEPLIRFFKKYTSNTGYISQDHGWEGKCMAAFSHFTYHQSGGQLIVCDLQGRYRYKGKKRFELTDIAICSRTRRYGPTDLGEKGIETFFANHVCNRFCHYDGNHWARPRNARSWFESTEGTSMISSSLAYKLKVNNPTRFTQTMQIIYDCDEDSDADY